MSDPLTTECVYCGSPEVLDDAWFCYRAECWMKYEVEAEVFVTGAVRCAGYKNPRPPADYGPRDERVFMNACRDRNCPADRCLKMPQEEWIVTPRPIDPSGE